MFAKKGDILQFCYTNIGDLGEDETRYSFGLSNSTKQDQQDGTLFDIKKHKYNETRTFLSRNFERFNVVVSDNDDLETSVISQSEMDEEYKNRPYSSLVRIGEDYEN